MRYVGDRRGFDDAPYEKVANKNAAGGYPGLDSVTGLISVNKLGTLASGSGSKYLADDGKWKAVSGGSSTWTETEVDFGSTPVAGAAFTVVDATVSGTSKIAVVPSGNAPTGGYADVWQWDSITFAATPGSGQFTLHAAVANGTTNGKRKVLYQVT